jgi:hypothetical protein
MATDVRINQLCKKDGGITVYEKVKAPTEYLKPDGSVDIDDLIRLKHREYFIATQAITIQTGSPTLVRHEDTLQRRSDNKVLARSIYYLRPWDGAPTYLGNKTFRCPEAEGLAALVKFAFPPQ